jgi:hypothetical protein
VATLPGQEGVDEVLVRASGPLGQLGLPLSGTAPSGSPAGKPEQHRCPLYLVDHVAEAEGHVILGGELGPLELGCEHRLV